jgi:hypothetical protein
MATFMAWIKKKHDLSPSDRDHGRSSIKIDINIGIWWFTNKLAELRGKSYNKTSNYSLWGQ